MLHVSPEPSTGAAATELIAALTRELADRYPDEDGGGLFVAEDAAGPRSVFLVAWFGSEPVGCGALRPVDASTAEVMRMYVAATSRGKGIGREILRELESRAATFGYTRLILETGVRQPEAIALYEKAGYEKIPTYEPHVGNPLSVCFAKRIAPAC